MSHHVNDPTRYPRHAEPRFVILLSNALTQALAYNCLPIPSRYPNLIPDILYYEQMPDIFVQSFTHLKDKPNADRALHTLQRIASLVKPIMRKRNWVLPVLSEFFPDNPSLLGKSICTIVIYETNFKISGLSEHLSPVDAVVSKLRQT